MSATARGSRGFLKSRFPVLFPNHPAFTFDQDQFEHFLKDQVKKGKLVKNIDDPASEVEAEGSLTVVSDVMPLRQSEGEKGTSNLDVGKSVREKPAEDLDKPAVAGLKPPVKDDVIDPKTPNLSNHEQDEKLYNNMKDRMFTENWDITYRSTESALVDLFTELEEAISGLRLSELLNAAWDADALMTLKIVFNARSIRIGKGSKGSFYKCMGWLAKTHPLTFLMNLHWLSRPVVEKKANKAREKTIEEVDTVLVQVEKGEADPTRFDVLHGVSHGYWKDLLNLLALSANNYLDVLKKPRDILNVDTRKEKRGKDVWDLEKVKEKRKSTKDGRYKAAIELFNEDFLHRTLHVTVARLFAEQLKKDLDMLRSSDPKLRKQISLCAKWAPSTKLFHDKHTFIVSSIAETLHSPDGYPSITDREVFLRHARENYRKDVATLRRFLEVVERDLTAQSYERIKYEHVPSIAMHNYAKIFIEEDSERFGEYMDRVAKGKVQTSGATLLPSTLIKAVADSTLAAGTSRARTKTVAAILASRQAEKSLKVVDAQWSSLVQRIRDSGKLENSIAVCDMSRSMTSPVFFDHTTPLHSAIALSLLLAEVSESPFGGKFITFSDNPTVQEVPAGTSLLEKYETFNSSDSGTSADFVAVFLRLILPAAREHDLKQEEMVKQVFVFSDMQFTQAELSTSSKYYRQPTLGSWGSTSGGEAPKKTDTFSSSYERIQKEFEAAGYEMPRLIFWNLAGGRAGCGKSGAVGDSVTPKLVTTEQEGTALVSGYSQGMLKAFLEGGLFNENEDHKGEAPTDKEEESEAEKGAETSTVVDRQVKKRKLDPLIVVKKAIGQKAYDMLAVYD